MLAGFKEDHRHIGLDAADQVEQHRALGAEARDDRGIAEHVLAKQHFKHLDGITAAKHVVEADCIGFGISGAGVDAVRLS